MVPLRRRRRAGAVLQVGHDLVLDGALVSRESSRVVSQMLAVVLWLNVLFERVVRRLGEAEAAHTTALQPPQASIDATWRNVLSPVRLLCHGTAIVAT